jgi:hypothetical protein
MRKYVLDVPSPICASHTTPHSYLFFFFFAHKKLFLDIFWNKINEKLNRQLSFQDDITSTDESCCDESSNDENFLINNQQNHQKLVQQPPPPPIVSSQRSFEDEAKQQLFVQTQNQKINEKMLDNQKLLLESLSSLPQNLLQSWIQSGQLQVSVDDGEKIFRSTSTKFLTFSLFFYPLVRTIRWYAVDNNPVRDTKGKFNAGDHHKENSDQASYRENQVGS